MIFSFKFLGIDIILKKLLSQRHKVGDPSSMRVFGSIAGCYLVAQKVKHKGREPMNILILLIEHQSYT